MPVILRHIARELLRSATLFTCGAYHAGSLRAGRTPANFTHLPPSFLPGGNRFSFTHHTPPHTTYHLSNLRYTPKRLRLPHLPTCARTCGSLLPPHCAFSCACHTTTTHFITPHTVGRARAPSRAHTTFTLPHGTRGLPPPLPFTRDAFAHHFAFLTYPPTWFHTTRALSGYLFWFRYHLAHIPKRSTPTFSGFPNCRTCQIHTHLGLCVDRSDLDCYHSQIIWTSSLYIPYPPIAAFMDVARHCARGAHAHAILFTPTTPLPPPHTTLTFCFPPCHPCPTFIYYPTPAPPHPPSQRTATPPACPPPGAPHPGTFHPTPPPHHLLPYAPPPPPTRFLAEMGQADHGRDPLMRQAWDIGQAWGQLSWTLFALPSLCWRIH